MVPVPGRQLGLGERPVPHVQRASREHVALLPRAGPGRPGPAVRLVGPHLDPQRQHRPHGARDLGRAHLHRRELQHRILVRLLRRSGRGRHPVLGRDRYLGRFHQSRLRLGMADLPIVQLLLAGRRPDISLPGKGQGRHGPGRLLVGHPVVDPGCIIPSHPWHRHRAYPHPGHHQHHRMD